MYFVYIISEYSFFASSFSYDLPTLSSTMASEDDVPRLEDGGDEDDKVSISSTFYEQLILYKSATFLCYLLKGHLNNTWHSCGQIHQHFTRAFFVQKCFMQLFFFLHVTREKLSKRLSYEKGARKMLMKLISGGVASESPKYTCGRKELTKVSRDIFCFSWTKISHF